MSAIRSFTVRAEPGDVGPRSTRAGRVIAHRRVILTAAALGAATLVAAGCGAAAAGSTSAPTTAATAPAASSPTAAKIIDAKLTEFKIALSDTKLSAGRYTFVATNAGHTLHSLSIKGPGVTATLPAGLQPGKSGRVTVTLQAGTYDVYCPVGDHKALGMNVELTVAATSGSSSGAAAGTGAASGGNGY